MKFTKIKNFTESNEVRIKASTSKGVIINKLVIYIGKEIADKYFGENDYVTVKVVKDKSGRNDIHLFIDAWDIAKDDSGNKLKTYKLAVTGNGTCQTRKLLISMPEDTDMNKYINNKSVVYSDVDNTLILHIDGKTKSKKPNKINKNKLIVNGIDQATIDKRFRKKFNLDKIDTNNQYHHSQIFKEIQDIKNVVSEFMLIEEKIKSLFIVINANIINESTKTNKNIESNFYQIFRDIKDGTFKIHLDRSALDYIEDRLYNRLDGRLTKLIESTNKENKRSLFGRIFGE